MSNKDIFHGPATVDLKIAITNGTDDAILTYSMPPGKYPTHQEIAAAIVEAVKEAPDDFRLMTKCEWWKLTSIEYFGGVYAMLGESTFDKFEPSTAPVQPQAELVAQADQDAARFVYLMSNLFSSSRVARNALIDRLAGMTYSDGCAAIDEAMKGTP